MGHQGLDHFAPESSARGEAPSYSRPTRRRLRRPSAGTVLGLLALVVAGTGTAAAAGSFVTIQDGLTSSTAKVDTAGRLSVIPPSVRPTTEWRSNTTVTNFFLNGSTGTVIAGPTTATLALAGFTWSPGGANTDPITVALGQVTGSSIQACATFAGLYRDVYRETAVSGTTVVHEPATPLRLSPPTAGQPWCLVALAFNDAGNATNNQSHNRVHTEGWVVSGTFSPPASAVAAARTPGDLPTSTDEP